MDQDDVYASKLKGGRQEAEFIKEVHATLRRKFKESTNFESLWTDHLRNSEQLKDYAKNMEALAQLQWATKSCTNRIDWCYTICQEYFFNDGYGKVTKKDQRREMYSQAKCVNAVAQTDNKETSVARGYNCIFPKWRFQTDDKKLFLLDVGSCYNPFKEISEMFSTVALDLWPSKKGVFRGDFLALDVFDISDQECFKHRKKQCQQQHTVCSLQTVDRNQPSCGSGQEQLLEQELSHKYLTAENQSITKHSEFCVQCILENLTNFSDTSKLEILTSNNHKLITSSSLDDAIRYETSEVVANRQLPFPVADASSPDVTLFSLPGGCFDVVVFSLLLSYLPSPRHRLCCCSKAWRLLRPGGLLLIIESDSSHQNRNVQMIKSWKKCLESIGFSRYRYEKHTHLHCMAFRKVSLRECGVSVDSNMMFIPQDFHNDLADKEEIAYTERTDLEDDEIKQYLDSLPSVGLFD